jgi:probable phosphoglycerate mutase
MTILLLIRHGMTDMVAQRRLSGWTPGVALNDLGRREAYALAGRLAHAPLQAIYASPLDRTLQTAQIVAAPHGLEVQVRERLIETDIGEWTGKLIDEVKDGDTWKAIQARPSGVRIGGGETIDEVQTRVAAELEAIRQVASPDGVVAVVSHGDPIKAAICYYLGLGLDYFQRLHISTASVTVLIMGEQGASLASLNVTGDLSYLRSTPQPAAGEQPAQPPDGAGPDPDHKQVHTADDERSELATAER